ncbi:MAG: hypothetical protein ACYTFO_01840 [Planctomycetota bacterium]
MSDPPAKPSVLEDHVCPLTGDPCQSGHPALCDHFWKCVREVLDQQRDEDQDPGADHSAGRAETG